jgi:hypothetical protein
MAAYYLLQEGKVLARVDDPKQCEASVFRNGAWASADHVAAKVTGIGGDADYDDVTETKAKELFPAAFPGRA